MKYFPFTGWHDTKPSGIRLRPSEQRAILLTGDILASTLAIYLALNYKLNKSYAVELGYMNWFQQQKSGIDFYNRDILRLSIFHSIDLKKEK